MGGLEGWRWGNLLEVGCTPIPAEKTVEEAADAVVGKAVRHSSAGTEAVAVAAAAVAVAAVAAGTAAVAAAAVAMAAVAHYTAVAVAVAAIAIAAVVAHCSWGVDSTPCPALVVLLGFRSSVMEKHC